MQVWQVYLISHIVDQSPQDVQIKLPMYFALESFTKPHTCIKIKYYKFGISNAKYLYYVCVIRLNRQNVVQISGFLWILKYVNDISKQSR